MYASQTIPEYLFETTHAQWNEQNLTMSISKWTGLDWLQKRQEIALSLQDHCM